MISSNVPKTVENALSPLIKAQLIDCHQCWITGVLFLCGRHLRSGPKGVPSLGGDVALHAAVAFEVVSCAAARMAIIIERRYDSGTMAGCARCWRMVSYIQPSPSGRAIIPSRICWATQKASVDTPGAIDKLTKNPGGAGGWRYACGK